MGTKNGMIERYCADCKKWYNVLRLDDSVDDNAVFTCPHCETVQRFAKCNRCGYEWKLHRPIYPNNCPKCKSPYFNNKRIQTRNEA